MIDAGRCNGQSTTTTSLDGVYIIIVTEGVWARQEAAFDCLRNLDFPFAGGVLSRKQILFTVLNCNRGVRASIPARTCHRTSAPSLMFRVNGNNAWPFCQLFLTANLARGTRSAAFPGENAGQ